MHYLGLDTIVVVDCTWSCMSFGSCGTAPHEPAASRGREAILIIFPKNSKLLRGAVGGVVIENSRWDRQELNIARTDVEGRLCIMTKCVHAATANKCYVISRLYILY